LLRALAAGDLNQAEAWLLAAGEEWALQLPSRWRILTDQLEDEQISRRLLPLLEQRLAEQPDALAWKRWLQVIRPFTAAKASVDQLLRIAPGHYLAFGWSSAGGVVEAVARSQRGRWIVRAESHARLRRDDVLELLALPVCQDSGFVMELRLERDELLSALWVDGCSCAVAATDVSSTLYLALVDSLLLLCQPSAMPIEALPHFLDAGVAEALLVHRTRLQTPTAWLDRIQACHAFGAPAKAAEVTVVIPLYRRWDFVLGQLAAFAMDPCFLQGRATILYVVDDPSIASDFLGWCLNHLQQELFQIDVVVLKSNVGFSLACDLGVLQAKTEHVCLLNSDVLPIQAGWLELLLDCMNGQPGALVAPLLLYEGGEIQHAGMEVEWSSPARDCTACIHPLKGLRPEGFTHLDPGADPFVVEALSGAALLFERERFLAMGGFDPVFGRGDFEDLDLSLRWQTQHGPCVIVPASRLTHLERQSISREPDRLALWRQRLNALMARWLFEQRGG
jgi:GT2 family glycosyltransferase